MAGPLASERPAAGAHLTGGNNWDEPKKDAIGVYRGVSQTRGQAQGGKVGVGAAGAGAFAGHSTSRTNLHEKGAFKKRLRK